MATCQQRVLLLDLDPQANATSDIGMEKVEGGSAYKRYMRMKAPKISTAITHQNQWIPRGTGFFPPNSRWTKSS